MDEYLDSLNNKQLKLFIGKYQKPSKQKITGLKRNELQDLLKELMVGGAKYKCIAGCPKGKCDCWYEKETINGAGLLDLFKKPKKDFSNSSKSTIKKFGDLPIVGLEVVRTPILKVLDRIINLISFGKFNKLKEKYGFDDLFHLQLVSKVNMNGHFKNVVLEKNEVINVSTNVATKNTSQMISVPVNRPITINELLNNARQKVGDAKFFLYDPFLNNCQNFILDLLNSSGLSNNSIDSFIKQDVSKIAEGLPSHVKKMMGLTTDLGARVSQAIGAGRSTDEYWNNQTKNDEFWSKNEQIRKRLNAKTNYDNRGYVAEQQAKRREVANYWNTFYAFLAQQGFNKDTEDYKSFIERHEQETGYFPLPVPGKINEWRWVQTRDTPITVADLGIFGKVLNTVGMGSVAQSLLNIHNNTVKMVNNPSVSNALDIGKSAIDSVKGSIEVYKDGPKGLAKTAAKNIATGALGAGAKYRYNPKLLLKYNELT